MQTLRTRKDFIRHIQKLEKQLAKQDEFIKNECTTRGEVLRMYATMRVAIMEALGDEAVKAVIAKVRELSRPEAYMFKNEATELFGDDMEQPKVNHEKKEV